MVVIYYAIAMIFEVDKKTLQKLYCIIKNTFPYDTYSDEICTVSNFDV